MAESSFNLKLHLTIFYKGLRVFGGKSIMNDLYLLQTKWFHNFWTMRCFVVSHIQYVETSMFQNKMAALGCLSTEAERAGVAKKRKNINQ
jgi:hypothetical protein